MTDQPTCEACRFCLGLDEEPGVYECHRFPPHHDSRRYDNVPDGLGIWPVVGIADWCGEHQPKEKPIELYHGDLSDVKERELEAALDGDISAICEAFDWLDTPQGSRHWLEIAERRKPLDDDSREYLVKLLVAKKEQS